MCVAWFDLLLLICTHQVMLLRIIWAAVLMIYAETSIFSWLIPQTMVYPHNVVIRVELVYAVVVKERCFFFSAYVQFRQSAHSHFKFRPH